MTHKCFKCDLRFPTSGKLVKHMRENHSSFVEDAQMKIDRSQENSLTTKKATQSCVSAAQCPLCKLDCKTRKKMMRHLDTDHKDDEPEVEPELKFIRLEKEFKDKILDQIHEEQKHDHMLQPQKTKVVSNLINAIGSSEGKSELVLPGTKETIEVSATSFKLSERRYRCFWCDTSFRKRGKLMDHIDIFHKASKAQTEVEAEMIHVSAVVNDAKKTPPTTTKEKKKCALPATSTKKTISKSTGKRKQQKQHQMMRQSSILKSSLDVECSETPNNDVCKFMLITSITEISRTKPKANTSDKTSNLCIFFNRKLDNPLPPPLPIEPPKVDTPEENIDGLEMYSTNYMPLLSTGHTDAYQSYQTPHQSLPTQSSFLTRPQPVRTMINSAFQAYQQQMAFQQTAHPFYLNPQQHQRMGLIDGCQQTSRGYNYTIPRMVSEPDCALDLTLPKYQWN